MAKSFTVGVVDYGMGNLHSVEKALALQGVKPIVSDNARRLAKSDLLVLPGVGSFGPAMKNLKKRGLDRMIRNWVKNDKPYLGICLGLQLLFDKSEEAPGVKGLGVLPGTVKRFRSSDFSRGGCRIPHMGWNQAKPQKKESKKFFRGLRSSDRFYFVHTYYAAPKSAGDVMTDTVYGRRFCSGVQRGNLVATQFHLEKSGEAGLRLLKNVLNAAKRGLL